LPFANCSTRTPTAPTGETLRVRRGSFSVDSHFAVYVGGEGTEPTYVLEGREALTPVFADLSRYEMTPHFMVASLRYLDTFVKTDGVWYFAERKLILDWSETRASAP
jgi:hypothetical protein